MSKSEPDTATICNHLNSSFSQKSTVLQCAREMKGT